ncbi:MAG: transcription-repair coupling factor, partial [Clostridia bacterium]|nr:transcription-repair coupling factor [Clostridia bacterium]
TAERIHIAWGLDKPTLFVVSDRVKAREYFEQFQQYEDNVSLLLERDDMLMYRKLSVTSDTTARVRALNDFINGKSRIMVATSEALMQMFPTAQNINKSSLQLKISEEINPHKLLALLVQMGYVRVDSVLEKGDFSMVGDIVSIFPDSSEYPVRISFFDEEIESIKRFDIENMKSIDSLDGVEIFSRIDTTFSECDLESIISKAKKSVKDYLDIAKTRAREIIEEIEEKIKNNNLKNLNWLLPFCNNLVGIEEILPADTIVVYDDPKNIFDHYKIYYNDFANRGKTLEEQGEITPMHLKAMRKVDVFSAFAGKFYTLGFANITSSNPIFEPAEIFSLNNPAVRSYYANYNSLFTDLKSFNLNGYRIVLCTGDEHTARSFVSSLKDNNIFSRYTTTIAENFTGIVVTPFTIKKGVNYPFCKFVLIGVNDLVRTKTISVSQKKRKTNVFTMPKVGDYVVHEVHGIGLCNGVEQIEAFGVKKDFVVINYAEGDKLYIPVDQMDMLERFSGSDNIPKLNRLGGKEFQKLKERVKNSVREMAFDLLELYRARNQAKGYKYPPDTYWQKEFEDSFEYTETDDQLKAIADIKSDMERGIVMDRLICGDVGYGKTEVALRAAFKTVMENKQVAILAPTTILARQHFNTASARFNESKIQCVLMSRFQSKEEIKKNLAKIESGQASVIIATHRLLSNDVKFKDLGLLILDEEQRFGVEHKEKIKTLKHNINVLTLSATPIPRTLNMALSGIRDISVLESPPKHRLPVETYVTELTDGLLIDSINREIDRDGQVYVLYNRVNDIEKIANKIMKLVPNAKVVVGHGQMSDTELEDAIDSFYTKKANVLVCTTIIENGIDLADANTLIVMDADKLGLSALYQLRGRVGRSDKQAYAYFTTKAQKVLTSDALKRLTAITDYTDFGSGFKIAMRDLEIRGAGNVLGKEQHGHIAKVGYDMYCKLLKEAVEEISGGEIVTKSNVDMKVDIDAYLDPEYIPSNNEKIKVYKDIAELKNTDELKEMFVDLKDRYGEPNDGLYNLMYIAVIKNMAGEIMAQSVEITPNKCAIYFDDNVMKNQKVIFAVSDMAEECHFEMYEKPCILFMTKM